MYVPGNSKVAVVVGARGLANVTAPGPENTVQRLLTVGPGCPSSETVPLRLTAPPPLPPRSGPALASGAVLVGGPNDRAKASVAVRTRLYRRTSSRRPSRVRLPPPLLPMKPGPLMGSWAPEPVTSKVTVCG